jgi:hypothetical protein
MYDDGTKVRYIKDGESPAPEYPESIDMKITNCCDLGCPMCAEQSSLDGKHAVLVDDLLIDSIHPYTELAIGGGNPLSHPWLGNFLRYMDYRNVICNLTVNAVHFMQNIGLIGSYAEHGLIHGLGVSVPEHIPDRLLDNLKMFPNAVVHTIAGVTPWTVYEELADHDLNLLILGFKAKGNGWSYFKKDVFHATQSLCDLKYNLLNLRHRFKAVAFDNLAVTQLELRDLLLPDEFSKLYMGDDGEFTMYIDLVTGKYGKSSTHELREIDADTVSELFQKLKVPLSETD